MPTPVSKIFLDFNLPNATTWLYFSFILAVALFFKFGRLLSVRNLDVVMMFLLVPGLLVVQASRTQPGPIAQEPAVEIAALMGRAAVPGGAIGLAGPAGQFAQQFGPILEAQQWRWFGYAWLLLGSVYFFFRCGLDLILVQRPALAPNLHIGGLAWLAGALFVSMLAVAYRQAERHLLPAGPPVNGPVAAIPALADQTVFAVAILWRHWPAWGVTVLAFVCHTVVLAGLVLIGWRHFQDLSAGMAAATFYLLLPYMGASAGQIQHVLPMAFFLLAILAYRWPTLAGAILGLATAATYIPIFVLPIWLSFYRNRGMGRMLVAFLVALGLGLLNVGLTLAHQGELEPSMQMALQSPAWQPWKAPTTEGFWIANIWAYRIPVFLVFLSFVIMTMFWPYPKNLAHVIALSAAVFVGTQWWCADQGGIYVLWYMPLLLLLVFRPNLHDRVPPTLDPERDWLTRALSALKRGVRRLLHRPEPIATKVG